MAAKPTTIQLGLYSVPVKLEVAVDKESSGTHAVCTGGGTHDPVRVKTHVDCTFPGCAESHSSVFGYEQRGVERDGELVLVTADEIKAASGTPIKDLVVTPHPREQILATTFAGDSVKYVVPAPGGERGYKAIRDALLANPHLVLATVQAPSTKNALWMLEVVDDHLVASKRCWPEEVRAKPAIPDAEVTDMEQTMLNAVVAALACDFDVTEYRDARRLGMAQLLESRTGVVTATTEAGAAPAPADMMAALQATLDQAKKKAPAKKAAAKRAPRKRAATKKEDAA